MAGIVGVYNQIPRMRNLVSNKIIKPESGSNPVDLGEVSIPNIRGQVRFRIKADDDPQNIFCEFSVTGGFGEYPQAWSQNWRLEELSLVNCSARTLQENRFEITSEVSSFGGIDRRYVLEFKSSQSFGPTIQQISPSTLGSNSLTVTQTKQTLIEGF